MGKSNKKIKSDRINSLKKKYDTFLDEDKKRKERNEYILEKLDKMRYCTAVIPVRQKPTEFTETQTAIFHNVPKQEVESPISRAYSVQRFLYPEIPKKHVDDTILQEISKKYILIPKLRPTCLDFTTDTKPTIDDNTDWKGKYQILEQLKRDEKEKEQDSAPYQEIFQAGQEKTNINNKENTIKDDGQPLLKYKNEMPDHILSETQLSYNLASYPKDIKEVKQRYYNNNVKETLKSTNDGLQTYKYSIKNLNLAADNVNERFENYESHIEDDVNDQTTSYENTDIFDKNVNNYEYAENVDESKIIPELDTATKIREEIPAKVYQRTDTPQNNIKNEYVPLESDSKDQTKVINGNQHVKNNQETYLDREEVTLVQDMKASDLFNAINHDIDPGSECNVVAEIEYPVEIINVQDFTPHADVQLEDGVNINPKSQVLVGQDDLTYHYDPIVENENVMEPTKIINAEQSHEFYNEQADQNYDYTEEAVVDNYNTEYTAPNENYEQNEYANYDKAQTEQAYPEINDNEETSQRYDQNYEQQYGGAYDQEAYPQQGYEQGFDKQEYTEQIQHCEAEDQAQHNFEKIQYEQNQDNLTPQYIEQQLDNEQGYAEKQEENIKIKNVEKLDENWQNLKVGDQQVQ